MRRRPSSSKARPTANRTYQFGVGAIYNSGPLRLSTDLAPRQQVRPVDLQLRHGVNARRWSMGTSTCPRTTRVEFSFRDFDTTNPAHYIMSGLFDRILWPPATTSSARRRPVRDRLERGPDLEFGLRYVRPNGSFPEGSRSTSSANRRIPLTSARSPSRSPVRIHAATSSPGTWAHATRDGLRGNIAAIRQLVAPPSVSDV